jgi:hypothetical protein
MANRKPKFEPSTPPVRDGNFQAWLDLLVDCVIAVSQEQAKAFRADPAQRLTAARTALKSTLLDAAKRRRGGGSATA